MNIKATAILVLVVAIVSAGITRYYFPQVQIKEVQVDHDVIKNNIQTIIKTVQAPDGTKTTTEQIVDNSVRNDEIHTNIQENKQTQWMFDVGARVNFTDKVLIYDVQAQRRILGPFFLGVKAGTDHSAGVSLGMEF